MAHPQIISLGKPQRGKSRLGSAPGLAGRLIRCRCAHQWVERELTCADYLTMIGEGIGQDYPSLEAAAQAAGYEGTLAGTYLAEPCTE